MSRFANLSSTQKSNDGFQVYSRRRNQVREVREAREVKVKDEKIIKEELFPCLSSTPLKPKEPVMNYLEKAKVLPKEEEKKEVIVEEKKEEVLFTQEEAHQVFSNLTTKWKSFEDEYIEEYGEEEYLKQYGCFLYSYVSSEEEEEEEVEEVDW